MSLEFFKRKKNSNPSFRRWEIDSQKSQASTTQKFWVNFNLTTILFSEKISILGNMRCTLRLDQFFMKILFFNNLLTNGQQLLTKFDVKAPWSIFSKRCIKNSWTKLIMFPSTQIVKSYTNPQKYVWSFQSKLGQQVLTFGQQNVDFWNLHKKLNKSTCSLHIGSDEDIFGFSVNLWKTWPFS